MKSSDDENLFKEGLWPIHLKLQDDELLSSWIVRLAHAHGYKVQTFCHILFKSDIGIGTRDIDVIVPEVVKEKLIVATGTSEARIKQATLSDYEGRLSETIQKIGNRAWILSQGLRARKPGRYGLMCCPVCLKHDILPYFRRKWRLAFITMCIKHGVRLIDRCPTCQSVISPFRSDMKGQGVYPTKFLIRHCWQCGYDLSRSLVEKVTHKNHINLQVDIENALRNGWIEVAGNSSLYSHLYFEGIKSIISGIGKAESLKRLNSHGELGELVNASKWVSVIEHADIAQRVCAMKILAQMLENWPVTFKDIVSASDLRHSELKGSSHILPYWYVRVLNEIAGNGNSVFTAQEKESVIDYVIRKKGSYKGSDIRAITGKDLSRYRKEKHKKCSVDIYDEFMVAIDHMIASTMNKNERLCLIRDKIMFGCGWVLNLTLQDLSDFKIDIICKKKMINTRFDINAKDKESIESWLVWYASKIRPLFLPKEECNSLFTSLVGKGRLKRSAISARFRHILDVGNFQHSIASYRNWLS